MLMWQLALFYDLLWHAQVEYFECFPCNDLLFVCTIREIVYFKLICDQASVFHCFTVELRLLYGALSMVCFSRKYTSTSLPRLSKYEKILFFNYLKYA